MARRVNRFRDNVAAMSGTSQISLADKVIVVTGGSRGIGEAIARGCLEAGAKVVIASRKQPDLDAAAIAAQKWVLDTFADAKLMIPGHGSAQTRPFPMVTWTLRYMQSLRDRTEAALDEGVDLQDAVDSIEFEDWKKVRLYGLNHRANVGFVYREMEAAAFD